MTRIYVEPQRPHCLLSAQGHAMGSEAVCAAVSGILYALAGYLACHEKADRRRHVMAPARALLEYDGDEGVEAAYTMAAIGLLQIEKAYPEQIKVTIKEKEKTR